MTIDQQHAARRTRICSTVTERIDPHLETRRARYGTGADEEQANG